MLGYAIYFVMIILNINLNVRNETKVVIQLRGYAYKIIVAAYNPRRPHSWYRLKAETLFFSQWSLREIIDFFN